MTGVPHILSAGICFTCDACSKLYARTHVYHKELKDESCVSLHRRTAIIATAPNTYSSHAFLGLHSWQLDSGFNVGCRLAGTLRIGYVPHFADDHSAGLQPGLERCMGGRGRRQLSLWPAGIDGVLPILPLQHNTLLMAAIQSNFECTRDFFIQFYRHVCMTCSSCSIEGCSRTGSRSPGSAESKTSVAKTTALISRIQ